MIFEKEFQMIKKIGYAITLLFPLTAFALNNGFYIGAGAGPESTDFKQTAYITQPGNFNAKDATHLSGTGVFGNIFGGYVWSCKYLYLAGEANYSPSSDEFNSSNSEFIHGSFATTSYKMRYSYSVSLLPGFLWTPCTLFYGRLGYAWGNFQTSTSDISLANVNRTLNGPRYGLGIKQQVYQNFSVRVEYSQIYYRSTHFTTFDPNSSVTKRTNITPSTGQTEFSLVYDFC